MASAKLSLTLRWLFRAPICLYRCKCSWLFGRRFMLLRHIGLRMGRHRQTVLELMEYRADGPEAMVMCAFGTGADWCRNIEVTPELDMHIGPRHFAAAHRILAANEAASVAKGDEQRNRFIAPIIRGCFGSPAGLAIRWLRKLSAPPCCATPADCLRPRAR